MGWTISEQQFHPHAQFRPIPRKRIRHENSRAALRRPLLHHFRQFSPAWCYPVNNYRPPYERLMSLKKWQQYLKPGIKADLLARQAKERSDTEAALRMQKAKLELQDKCRSMPR